MNLWAQMLAELPATGQRVVARAQRISLPRGCDAATRLLRLRQALCHAATVRAVYTLLDPPAQAALQHLRALHGGISPAELAQLYGPIRPWRDLDTDPHPRTLSEQLLLLGWLLPRPATPRHPVRFLVPPEVRRWLPDPPPTLPSAPPAPPTADLPALRAAITLLLACADQPLLVTLDGTLRREALRQITPRLAPTSVADHTALLDWLLPLLIAQDLLSSHQGRAALTIAGQRFLALPPAQQQALLRDAWLRSPVPDLWLLRLLVDPRGIDWPLLRRRLWSWAQAIPTDDPRDPATQYAQLARSFGPLADAQTHGFRPVDRAPWQLKRAIAVWTAAVQGPLAWLGLIGVPASAPPPTSARSAPSDAIPHHRMRNPPRPGGSRQRRPSRWRWPDAQTATDTPAPAHPVDAREPDPLPPTPVAAPAAVSHAHDPAPEHLAAPTRWCYAAPGVISVPHSAPHAATLRLLPFARWDSADATATHYRITAASLTRARSQGSSAATCRQLLEAQAGPLPEGWCAALDNPPPAVRLVQSAVLLGDAPAVLGHATRSRSVRRHLQRIAPGIALVRPEDRAPLVRALERQGIACIIEGEDGERSSRTQADTREPASAVHVRPPAPTSTHRAGAAVPPVDLSPGERAALLIACAHYRQHAPAHAPLLPHTGLEARLRVGLSPALHAAIDAALADLRPPPMPAITLDAAPAPLTATIDTLRDALARQRPLELTYDTAGQGALTTRTVRPLALDQRHDTWYLRAYCSARQAERTFRVDRIVAAREV